MDNSEAKKILESELHRYRSLPYSELVKLFDTELCTEIRGQSGTTYQLEIQIVWDDQPSGNVRVLGSIDDGGWRAFIPLTDSFILSPDGLFVGE